MAELLATLASRGHRTLCLPIAKGSYRRIVAITAERLNRNRHHECWLKNLLISASLGGYRGLKPRNP